MRVAVVGGGPGGLFAATLIRQADPAHEVTVFERNRADDTFGFGVVFSDATLAGIHAADPVLRTALTEHGVHWDAIEVRLQGERHPLRRQRDGRGRAPDAAVPAATAGRRRRGCELPVLRRGRTPATSSPPATTSSSPPTARTRGSASGYARRCSGRVGRDGDRQVHLARHRLPVRRADVRPRARPARRVRRARLPDRQRGLDLHRRDRRAVLARGRPRRVRRHPAAGPERREEPRLPAAAVRRADRRAPAAGEQLPLGQLPHPPGTARWQHRAGGTADRVARRRRAHRPLLGRLGHEDGDGGRDRPGGRAGRPPG